MMMNRLLPVLLLLCCAVCFAAPQELVNCRPYRAKREGVPVYREADLSSAVVKQLKLGEYVCGIGLRDKMVIVDWQLQEEINQLPRVAPDNARPTLVYVVETDLWEKEGTGQRSEPNYVENVTEYFNALQQGVSTDDPLLLLAPFLEPLLGNTKCKAGKICEKVDESLNQKHYYDRDGR